MSLEDVPYYTSLLELGLLCREIEKLLDQVVKLNRFLPDLKHRAYCVSYRRSFMSFCLLSFASHSKRIAYTC